MGLNNIDALRYVIDIETVSLADAEQYLDPIVPIPEPDLSLVTAAKNLTDPVKIAADLEKRKQAALEAYREACEAQQAKRREMLEKCALDLDLCRIVAIGWMREDWNEPTIHVACDDATEAVMLHGFWDELDNRVTIGYNQVGFDLPILLRRSLYLGVHAPQLNLDKYRSPHIDLQQRLSLSGTKPYRSLNWYCKRMGLDVPCDETSGKDIGQLVAAGDWNAVCEHCRADVLKTKALAERMGLLKPQSVEEMVL